MNATLLAQAQHWLNQDPDPETQAELNQLITAAQNGNHAAQTELSHRFDARLQFGTGGLRGKLQAGSMGMNRVLVSQSAAGLAAYLHQYDKQPSIVIAYDGRKNSAIFAQDTAEIMVGAGIQTQLFAHPVPTPVLAFALRHLNYTAAVMVTASHNPPQDNGYKVYLGKENGGSQIISPADQEIAALIEHYATQDIRQFPRQNTYTFVAENVLEHYIQATAALAQAPACPLNYVYTALHGVGKDTLLRTLQVAHLPLPHLVAEQAEPDAQFPTVAFPNPEEKGALDLAYQLAEQVQAEFILANDPDADRLGVAIPDASGKWQALHGNLIGCLLAWHIAKQAHQQGRTGTLACSLVSTPALAAIAEKYQLKHVETLTGFKYIAKVDELIYGFEESLGYLVDPQKVRDKDGISAAIAFLDMVAHLKAQGQSLNSYIDDFTQKFGFYASSQISLRVAHLNELPKMMAAFRQHQPDHFGQYAVVNSKDYLQEKEANDILVYHLEHGCRVIIRPSGTEPKVKIYLDVKGNNVADAQQQLQQLDHAVRNLLRSEQYGCQHC